MSKKLKCVMLVDDDQNDNFFHKREIIQTNAEITILEKTTGLEALEYLKANKDKPDMLPDLIFLDINMPILNGWEFLDEFNQMDKGNYSGIMIVMLSTSGNPEDKSRARTYGCISDYITKPLTREIMREIKQKYFV